MAAATACAAIVLWPDAVFDLAMFFYKALAPVDKDYSRSGVQWPNVSAVGRAHAGGGWQSLTLPTDKTSAHNYLAVYDHLLPPLRGTPAVLEVGVKKGGSLVLWREYFSDKTSVFGVDVDRFGPTFPRDAGVKVLSLDSQDADAMRRAFGTRPRFGVIVDDGCHLLRCIWRTFRAAAPLLLSNGVYLIEDYPRYGLAPGTNDTLSNTSRKVLLAASVHGRRRACVFADTTPTEVLVVLYPEHSSTPRGCRKGGSATQRILGAQPTLRNPYRLGQRHPWPRARPHRPRTKHRPKRAA